MIAYYDKYSIVWCGDVWHNWQYYGVGKMGSTMVWGRWAVLWCGEDGQYYGVVMMGSTMVW